MPPKKTGKSNAGDSVRVAIRVRPHTFTDGGDNRCCVTLDHEIGQLVCKDPDGRKVEKTYNFDTVFAPTAEQKDVFENIGLPMVEAALEGYNVTLFTYGQTGSGKTYTIQGLPGAGVRAGQDYDVEQHKGLTPRIAEYLFERVTDMVDDESTLTAVIEMAYLEIYNEQVRDLLVASSKRKEDIKGLDVREDSKGKPYVEGLSWKKCLNSEKIMEHLLVGNTRRQVAATKMNEVSSRSHSIVMIRCKMTFDPPNPSKPDTEALLYIVDLAGSERIEKTGAEGDTLSEAKNINKSLLMLGRAIHAFGEKGAKAHVPLRDSKLTRLLKESFGGNSRTWMIATCSASPYNMIETKSSLDYAANAKLVTNAAQQNKMARQLELGEQKELNKKLEMEIAELKEKLANVLSSTEEEAKKLALEMSKGHSQGIMAELDELKRENKKLQDDLTQAAETESELRTTIAKGVKSDVADQLRKELDEVKAENERLKKELTERDEMETKMAGAHRGRDTGKSSTHLRTGSPTQGMGGKRPSMQKQMQDLLDDPNASYEERVKRMENRALVESASSFVRKKSFSQLYQQSTGYAPRGSWGGLSRPHTYASIQNGSTLPDLQKAKERAIQNEDFTEAQRLTEEIKCLQALPSVGINDLMAARARAIASDDFAEAQKIQAQINVLKSRESGGAQTPRDAQMMSVGNRPDPSSTPRPLDDVHGGNRQMFVGRASISLRFLVQGNATSTPSKYHTLPLECNSNVQLDPMCPPQLLVNIYQLDNKKGRPDDGRMDFVIHVIQAKGIPKQFSHSVHCKYVFKWGEKEYYKSDEVKNSTEPQFDYKKRYAFPKITDQLYGWFTSENVMTFEVIGLGAPSGGAVGAKHADPAITVSPADPREAGSPGTARRQGSPYY